MKIRVKNDTATIEGYVNVVERDSDVLCEKGKTFIERIRQGTFARALRRGRDVKVLFNHDSTREVASSKAGSATLKEDAVGLWCRAKVTDPEVVGKAKEGKLSGWSFGFLPIRQKVTEEDGIERHEVSDIDLREVSILDDTKCPAYPANLIMTRDNEEGETIEIRSLEDTEVEVREEENATPGGDADKSDDKSEEAGSPAENYSYHNRLLKARIRK